VKHFLTAFAAAALFVGGAAQIHAASVPLSKEEVKELAATATTPSDHLKLAAYFNGEADRFQAEAVEHETMANAHRISTDAIAQKHTMSGNTAGHCDYFGKVARGKAKTNRELANEHEQMAKAAEK
jgi:hypothetical protein